MDTCGGKFLVELFQNYGVEYIFCSPGSEWVPVWEELSSRYARGDKGVKYINCRHESLAVAMAMGYRRWTGKLPVVLLHAGVGPLQAAIAIRTAYIRQIPMVICSAEDADHGESDAVKPGGPHWISNLSDIGGPAAMVRPYVKWSNTVASKSTLIDSVYRACHIAQAHPQGPVFLAFTREVLFEPLSEPKVPTLSSVAGLPQASSGELEEVANLLIHSRKPIIVTEHAGKSTGAVDKLTELSELLAIPVFECRIPVVGNFPKNHPMHMGHELTDEFRDADTVFVLGATVPWYPPSSFPGKNTKVICLDETPMNERLPFWGLKSDLLLTADISQSLSSLIDMIRTKIDATGPTGSDYRQRFEQVKNSHNKMMGQLTEQAMAEKNKKPLSARWFFHTIGKTMPVESIIVDETISHSPLLRKYLAEPDSYVRGSCGGLGMGLGEAAGAKVASGNRPVIFIVGDGTFNYNPVSGGLGVLQEYNLSVLTIILNNAGYLAMSYGYHRHFPEGWAAGHKKYLGVNIEPPPDYVKLAEAFGAYGEKIEEPEDLEPALNRAFEELARGRSVLLDVIVDTQ